MGGLVSVLRSGTRWGLCAGFDLGFSAFGVWSGRSELRERGNRVAFKGILRFLDHSRWKWKGEAPQQARRVGFGGRAGVPASRWQSQGPGARRGSCSREQGQEKHPQHCSFFIERPGWAFPSSTGKIALSGTAALHGRAVILHGGAGGALWH